MNYLKSVRERSLRTTSVINQTEMSTMTSTTIASMRKQMLEGGIPAVLTQLASLENFPDIYMNTKSVKEILLRDVVTYTFLHSVSIIGGTCYGSFLPAHLSGLHYNDIDFLVPSMSLPSFYFGSVIYTILGIDYEHITVKELGSNYAKRYSITVSIYDVKVNLSIDITNSSFKKLPTSPSTFGTSLEYNLEDGIMYRQSAKIPHKFYMPLKMLVSKLKRGEDVQAYSESDMKNLSPEDKKCVTTRLKSIVEKGYKLE